MRIISLVLVSLAACGSSERPAASPLSSSGATWRDVVRAAGDARDPVACGPDHDFGAALRTFGEQQVRLKRYPDDAETARAVRLIGRRLQREGASLADVAIGDTLVDDAEARLAELGQPIPHDPEPPLLGALAAELLCAVATVEEMYQDPQFAGGKEVIDAEVANTRRLALAYFDEVRVAGDDPTALQRLVEPAEARTSKTTPAAALVLEEVPSRYAGLARDRAARR